MTRAYQAARAAYIGAFSYATVLVGGFMAGYYSIKRLSGAMRWARR